jgi:hypothetical protein
MPRYTPWGSIRSSEAPVGGCLLSAKFRAFRRLRGCMFACAAILLAPLFVSPALGQTQVLTQHYDNARTGQNTNEVILSPANVNPAQFGKIFSQSLDGMEAGQPLYVPNVFIPALNAVHNVVYVATMHDSVYAFDAQDAQGGNASPLWYASFLNPATGIGAVPVQHQNCGIAGYNEFGIQGTPAIDIKGNAIYVLAMTEENGAFVHKLHALDLGTGEELFGGPTTVTATALVDNTLYPFIDQYQQQRPGLLLQNGVVYIGFGSCGCNIKNSNGWVMAYDATTLEQVGVFDASPGVMASAIWMSGVGLAGDGAAGNVYANTGDGLFDVDDGGSHYGDTLLKLNQGNGTLDLVDYFTPWNQKYFQVNDLDLSSGQVLLLPPGPEGNYAITIDKNGSLYLLNQSDLGQYNPVSNSQIVQEVDVPVEGEVHGGLTFWNNTVYVMADDTPVMAYPYSGGQLSLQPTMQTPKANVGSHGGIVSSNGGTNGIFWYATSPSGVLYAFDATNLANDIYSSNMVVARDKIGPVVHFEMPTVADGRVYVNGQTALTVFGLLPVFTAAAGNNQTGLVGTMLNVALQAALQDPYSGEPIQTAGIAVRFSDGNKGGSFSNPNPTTDSHGIATTYYTLPKKPGTYTLTAASLGYASATYVETSITSDPESISIYSGNAQKGAVASLLPKALSVKVKDDAGNGLAGIQVNFSDGGAGGTLSQPTAITNSSGIASTSYTTGTQPMAVQIAAAVAQLNPAVFKETVIAGPAATLSLSSGNNQSAKAGAYLAKPLQVMVEDQYGNPTPGISVAFDDGGAGGSFSPENALSNGKGLAQSRYKTPPVAGTVTVTASTPGTSPVSFTINVR